jgi:hypothetical protein
MIESSVRTDELKSSKWKSFGQNLIPLAAFLRFVSVCYAELDETIKREGLRMLGGVKRGSEEYDEPGLQRQIVG